MVPLSSYMLLDNLQTALLASVAVTLLALFAFGYFKGKMTGIPPLLGGFQTVVIGGLISATLLTLLVLPALYALFGTADPLKAKAQPEEVSLPPLVTLAAE